jgi:hypothetical protein
MGQSLDRKVRLWWRNFYRCSECGAEWIDYWNCQCNDRCPNCNVEIEPYKSEDTEETP